MAKELCERENMEYTYIDILQDPKQLTKLTERMGKMPDTVPQIFHHGTLIEGGYAGLVEYVDVNSMNLEL